MTQIIRIPRNHNGEKCLKCWNMMRANKTYQEAKAEHARCHGWTHCGNGCCGNCEHCGTGRFQRELEEAVNLVTSPLFKGQ